MDNKYVNSLSAKDGAYSALPANKQLAVSTGPSASRSGSSRSKHPHRHGPKSFKLRLIALLLILSLMLPLLSSCSTINSLIKLGTALGEMADDSDDSTGSTRKTRGTSKETTEQPDPTPTPEPEPLFDQQVSLLASYGIGLEGKSADSIIDTQDLNELIVETYEALAGEIDIYYSNPFSGASDDILKLLRIDLYDYVYYKEAEEHYEQNYEIFYSTAADSLYNLFEKLFYKTGKSREDLVYPQELIDFINISNALNSWEEGTDEFKIISMEDVLGRYGEELQDRPLTKLVAARILVESYEGASGNEVVPSAFGSPSDSDDPYVQKAFENFIWSEYRNHFGPNEKISGYDLSTIAIYYYNYYFQDQLDLAYDYCPYGAIVAALCSLISAAEKMTMVELPELVVLNERHYIWYINQHDTGEYGSVNCMPTCIEMSFRYQNLSSYPSAEEMRAGNPQDGQGWTAPMAREEMQAAGLVFYESYAYDYNYALEEMFDLLDEGYILYIMYRDEYVEEDGHAVIIKGYYMEGDHIRFILSDPDSSSIGLFGYTEYLEEIDYIIEGMLRHEPLYFIIPSEEMLIKM